MIVGIFLRNIKAYQGINYVPLGLSDKFCGLVGNNGVGKSTVLEALDSYFNGRDWNLNASTRKAGVASSGPYIVPIFLIKKEFFIFGEDLDSKELVEGLSDFAWGALDDEVALTNRQKFKEFRSHAAKLAAEINKDEYYLLPLGITYEGLVSLSIFNCRALGQRLFPSDFEADETIISAERLTRFDKALSVFRDSFRYLYVPREMDPEVFTGLEADEIQMLMGKTLYEILDDCVGGDRVREINDRLNSFIGELSGEIDGYSYRTPTNRQQNLKKNDVYNLIIDAFFAIRKLHKESGDHWLDISVLSSGEKQKAIIDVAHSLLSIENNHSSSLILAVDEPEASLHISGCYDQFRRLFEIGGMCAQVLFSSHWYGFFPAIERGSVTVISQGEEGQEFDLINLARYREDIRRTVAATKGGLPHDIRLKSVNDFVQSILSGVMCDEPFSWLICEGSSEKIYFSEYFKDMTNHNLRIIPVGGAAEIRRIYKYIEASYDDFRGVIRGKIFLLSDTDAELVNYDTRPMEGVECKRIVNSGAQGVTRLVNISANPVSPKTSIEDALNGQTFYKTLLSYKAENLDFLDFLDQARSVPPVAAMHALDLRGTEVKKLEQFLSQGNNKLRVARKYVELMREEDEHVCPAWVSEIRAFFS